MDQLNSNKAIRHSRGKFVWQPVVVVAFIHLLAIYSLNFFSSKNFAGFLVSHFLVGGLGAVIGLHRYFSHHSFRCKKWVEYTLAIFGTLNWQHGPITWAMYHRAHHRFNEGPGDPHSASNGFLWSHFLWLFYLSPNGFRKNFVSIRDLSSDRFLCWIDRHHTSFNIAAIVAFYFATGDLGLTLWVFPARIVAVWHSTWLINSYIHSAKFKPQKQDVRLIKNSWLLSILMYGDGWHRNHHHHPALPRAGLKWFEFDPAFQILRILNWIGIIQFTAKR